MRKVFYISAFFELDEDFEGTRLDAMRKFTTHLERTYEDPIIREEQQSSIEESEIEEKAFSINWNKFEIRPEESRTTLKSAIYKQDDEVSNWETIE